MRLQIKPEVRLRQERGGGFRIHGCWSHSPTIQLSFVAYMAIWIVAAFAFVQVIATWLAITGPLSYDWPTNVGQKIYVIYGVVDLWNDSP